MTRDRTTHTMARLVTVGLLAFLLAGCIKFDTDLTVSSDDTVSGTMILGFDKALLEMTGGSMEDAMGSGLEPLPDDVEGITTSEYEDDDYVGQEFTLDGVPLEEFNEDGEAGALQIERDGDVFRLSGNMDMSGDMGDLGSAGDLGMDPSALLGGADLQISITFPGEVLESNGEVDGNTVTWEPDLGGTNELTAVAEAEAGGAGSLLWILLVLLVVVAAVVAFLLLRRRRQPMVSTGVAAADQAMGTQPGPDSTATPPTTTTPNDPAAPSPPPPSATTSTAPPPPSSPPPPPASADDTTELPGSRDDTNPMPPPPPA